MIKPYELKVLETRVSGDLDVLGLPQFDKRLNRNVVYLAGYTVVVDDGNLVRWLKGEKPLEKYQDDWKRMDASFKASMIKAEKDGDSRQLVIFNSDNFVDVMQCFTQMQFVKDHAFNDNEYILIVTQRSGDMSKFEQDLIFFGSIARKWEVALKTKVRKIIINYGNLHHEKQSS